MGVISGNTDLHVRLMTSRTGLLSLRWKCDRWIPDVVDFWVFNMCFGPKVTTPTLNDYLRPGKLAGQPVARSGQGSVIVLMTGKASFSVSLCYLSQNRNKKNCQKL